MKLGKALRKMDELKQSVQLCSRTKDPLLIYKFGFNLFNSMLNGVNKEVISFLFKGDLPQQSAQTLKQRSSVRKRIIRLKTKYLVAKL
jgi:preprotein translocase subunit SecA